jgi:predicted SAM-dependent methyltransferase
MADIEVSEALSNGPVRVHLGGELRSPGWIVINPKDGAHVDIKGDHRKLAAFPRGSVRQIYASHVVEHLPPHDLGVAMDLMKSTLEPGGQLMVSVPDLLTLCQLFADPSASSDERFMLMRMMYGGHLDEYDVHHTGFDENGLRGLLEEEGYVNIKRVEEFQLFDDTSRLTFKDKRISLNIVADKPR